jgi:hypothetical protein
MRALVIASVLATGCAMRAAALPAQHPGSPGAETGRLAGAPPSLRPGVVDYKEVPVLRKDDDAGSGHEHHKR